MFGTLHTVFVLHTLIFGTLHNTALYRALCAYVRHYSMYSTLLSSTLYTIVKYFSALYTAAKYSPPVCCSYSAHPLGILYTDIRGLLDRSTARYFYKVPKTILHKPTANSGINIFYNKCLYKHYLQLL
jgi:hypothetical protein